MIPTYPDTEQEGQQCMLVFPLMRTTLYDILFTKGRRPRLPWQARCSILQGVCRTLCPGGISSDLSAAKQVIRLLLLFQGIINPREQVAEGLRYLHNEVKIVHRDLKPENIFLSDDLTPVLGDYGIHVILYGNMHLTTLHCSLRRCNLCLVFRSFQD